MSRPRLVAAILLLAAACGSETQSVPVKFMTRNLYLGGPIELLLADIVGGVDETTLVSHTNLTWNIVKATNFAERAKSIAAEIAAQQPDVVGLQEVGLWRSGSGTSYTAAATVEYDFLALLQGELQARGLSYAAAAVSQNFDGGLSLTAVDPMNPAGARPFVRYTDRDVILARSGVTFDNARHGNYLARLPLAPTLVVLRGWTAIDLSVGGYGGGKFTAYNTHLEVETTTPFPLYMFQASQANELLQIVAANPLPVVLLGDLNSDAYLTTTQTYSLLKDAGFGDPYSDLYPGQKAFTCCNADPFVRADPVFTTRIDHTLYLGQFRARAAVIVGSDPSEKTPSGLWPSDHAGLVTTLDFRFLGR